MNVEISEELIGLMKEIVLEDKTLEEWAEVESDDMYQSDSYVGGYDADEEAFCFSYFDENKNELWFQFTLDEAIEALNGKIIFLVGRPADY